MAATNIISSFSTSNDEADAYTFHYLSYRRAIPTLFGNTHSLLNHHYAMHNRELLKWWGPLAALSEFPGEGVNGMFQKISTNKHI